MSTHRVHLQSNSYIRFLFQIHRCASPSRLRKEVMADSQQAFNAGEAKGHAQEKANQWVDSVKDTANAAKDKACEAAHDASDSLQQTREQSAGFLQQTGEQIKNMAQGAADSVKNTLGIGEQGHK